MDKKESDGYNALDSPIESEEKSRKINPYIIGSVCVLILILIWATLSMVREPGPPTPDTVASYNGKNISIEDLNVFLEVEGAREGEHYICEKHGLDHSKCDASEACEQHPIDSKEGYRAAVRLMATEQIIQDWAKEKGLTQREEVQHGISDLFDHANVDEVLTRISKQQLSSDTISKLDVQLYFEENKEQYAGKTLTEAEEEIRQILVQKKDEEYFPAYIEELKKTAGLQVNYELLKEADFSVKESEEENAGKGYDMRMNEALFTVHGKKYTLGEFYQEFQELPATYKETFSNYEKRKLLVDQLIAKELLLEEGADMADTKEGGHELEELKIEYLSQLLHKEEVDQKLEEVTEEEISAFYEKNKAKLIDKEGRQFTYEETKDDIGKHLKDEKHYELTKEVERTILEESNFMIYDKTIRKMLKEQKGDK